MRWELNISWKGRHWGRVTLSNDLDEAQVRGRAQYLDTALRKEALQRGDGDFFTLDISKWTETGQSVELWP